MATIEKRGDSYRITVSAGYDLQGKQIKKRMTWRPAPTMTQRQVEKELERQSVLFEEDVANGLYLNSSIRFADFADIWINDYAIPHLRPSTVNGYKRNLARLNEHIGHIKLCKLQPHNVNACYKAIAEEGKLTRPKYTPKIALKSILKERGITRRDISENYGIGKRTVDNALCGKAVDEKTAKSICVALDISISEAFIKSSEGHGQLSANYMLHLHRLLSSILEKAVKWQVIAYNPCRRIDAPKIAHKEAAYLDEYQAQELLECLSSEPLQYRAAISLLLYSGMRRGELCGLEWSDIDFENDVIDINKTSLYLSDRGIFNDETKTASSRRVIKLPPDVMSLLLEHRRKQLETRLSICNKWENNDKVFTQWNGRPIHPDTLTRWFSEFVKRHNLPPIHLHSLRHTNATLLIASGTDLRTVSKRLGHSNMTTTGNIYTHAIKSADERAAETLSDILHPLKNRA